MKHVTYRKEMFSISPEIKNISPEVKNISSEIENLSPEIENISPEASQCVSLEEGACASLFELQYTSDGRLQSLMLKGDPEKMNWVQSRIPWGTVIGPDELEVTVHQRILPNGHYEERYVFRNSTAFDVFPRECSVGIAVPFADSYQDAETCMKRHCHTHIWCGENSSWIAAVRMNGEPPSLGLALTEGSLVQYSVERDPAQGSNDRGVFLVHPYLGHFRPGQEKTLAFELFWFQDRNEFLRICRCRQEVGIWAERYVLFEGEMLKFLTRYRRDAKLEIAAETEIHGWSHDRWQQNVMAERRCVQRLCREEMGSAAKVPLTYPLPGKEDALPDNFRVQLPVGRYRLQLMQGRRQTHASVCVLPRFLDLVYRRCCFIAERQQYHEQGEALDGAYLIYDNESRALYYSHQHDHNGGRERMAMGILIARFLHMEKEQDWRIADADRERLQESLAAYEGYVYRELLDRESGVVSNDCRHSQDWNRLYNYPWAALFCLELYGYHDDAAYLTDMYRILMSFYQQGGSSFYAIHIPMEESIEALRQENRLEEAEELLRCYREQGDRIAALGYAYPAHEVNYEQSIVAPAASYLLQLYLLTGEERYAEAGAKQLQVLVQFNGHQPDYHLYETAIRHWDGYWFGKNACYGDTFPHYWSSLSGIVFALYADVLSRQERMDEVGLWKKRAEDSLRGCLSLFHSDGSASCAVVFPWRVNGQRAHYEDPWANDQDWGLYHMLRYQDRL